MADKKGKGFEGLDELLPKDEQPREVPAPSKLEQDVLSSQTGRPRSPPPPPPPETDRSKAPSEPDGDRAVFWFLGVVAGLFLFGQIVSNLGDRTRPRPTPAPARAVAPAPAPDTPSSTVSPRPTPTPATPSYVQPPVGTNRVLNESQIRWCLREDIRLEALRPVVQSDPAVDAFNRLISNYNSRCGQYRYYERQMSQARQDVERERSSIRDGALDYLRTAGGLGSSARVGAPPVADPLVQRTQRGLNALGYDAGPEDGLIGERTRAAIRAFQLNQGLRITGQPSAELLTIIQLEVTYRDALGTSATPASTGPSSSAGSAGYFTRGSTAAEVRRIQGPPDNINTYSSSGYEVWRYGPSTVQIDLRTQRVTEWNNGSGRLRVRLVPGSRTTSASRWTRGSHVDDLARIQGTPTAIDVYSSSGYEIWRYGSSTVQVDLRSQTVTEWNNSSASLQVSLMPGSRTTSASRWTRGSHIDDLVRIQGTPTAIDVYGSSGYEVWRYGSSTVQINLRSQTVTEWNNSSGRLRVRLTPSGHTTSNTTWTRGSHVDDLIRIQGTPTAIDVYSSSGYEVWRYGSSTVQIDFRSQTVTEWNNSARNLRIR